MPHRDPETGQFVSDSDRFEDIEVATGRAAVGVAASNLSGGTNFAGGDEASIQGALLFDYDDLVDRNESLHLLHASHALTAYANSTETADGTVRVTAEVSSSASIGFGGINDTAVDGDTTGSPVGEVTFKDTIDLVGRPLVATGHAPFSDGPSGVGGGGSAGEDRYSTSMFPQEFGSFHPRDELYTNFNFEVWNIADAGVHADLTVQHVYGVVED